MPCKPPCVSEYIGTDREKWEYVRRFYGALVNASDAFLNAEFLEEWQQWQDDVAAGRNVIFEKWLQWHYQTGSLQYGNLAAWTKYQHAGHCWAPCPYSTQSSGERTRAMLGLASGDPLPTQNDHTLGGKIYYMTTEGKGSAWGFECTFDTCSYYVANGERYFYI